MHDEDFTKLAEDVETELLHGATNLAILGATPTALRLLARLASTGLERCVHGIYSTARATVPMRVPIRPIEDLQNHQSDVVAVADDTGKEDLLTSALPFLQGAPKVVVAGYGHLAYRDPTYHQELAGLLVPSLANGYPHTLPHLHQCLTNAARLGLQGVVAE